MTKLALPLVLALSGCLSQELVDVLNTPASLENKAVDTHRSTFDACAAVADAPELAGLERDARRAVSKRCADDVRAAWEPLLTEFDLAGARVCRVFRGADGCPPISAPAAR